MGRPAIAGSFHFGLLRSCGCGKVCTCGGAVREPGSAKRGGRRAEDGETMDYRPLTVLKVETLKS